MVSIWLLLSTFFSAIMGAVLPTVIIIKIFKRGQGCIGQTLQGGMFYFLINYIVISFFTAAIGYYIKISKDNMTIYMIRMLMIVLVISILELLGKYFIYGFVAKKNNTTSTILSYASGYSFAAAMIMVGFSSLNIFLILFNLKIGNIGILSSIVTEGKTVQGLIAAYQNLDPKLYLLSGFQAVVTILYEMINTYIWFRYFKDRKKQSLIYLISICVLYNGTIYAVANLGVVALLVGLLVQLVILITLVKHLHIDILKKWKYRRTFIPAKG